MTERYSPDIEPHAGCICQDQHRRGYCTEPGCPYSDPEIMKARDEAATPSIVDATGWLIEKDDPPVYCVLSDDYDEHWTNDANRALRFARQEDAQAYSDHIGWTSPPVRIAEHMWPERTRNVAQPKQECRHPNKFGSGTCSTDGSGTLSWHCQACGASGHDSWGPMIPSTEHK